MRRTLRHLVAVVTLALATVGLVAAPAAASPESSFVSKINSTRAANGLGPLEVYWDLTDDAEAHSKAMKAASELYHNPNLANVTSGWSALAENVGVGPDVARLHEAFMDSSGHRRNILGDFNYVGVGVVRESDTKIWVTVVFMRGPDGLVSPPDEDPPPDPEPEPAPDPEPEPTPDPAPTPKPPSPTPTPPGPSTDAAPERATAPAEPVPMVVYGCPPRMRPYAI